MTAANSSPYNPDLPLRLPEFTLLSRAALHQATLQANLAQQKAIDNTRALASTAAGPNPAQLSAIVGQFGLMRKRVETVRRMQSHPMPKLPERDKQTLFRAIENNDAEAWTQAMAALAQTALCAINPVNLACLYLAEIDKQIPISTIPPEALRALVNAIENEAILDPNPEKFGLSLTSINPNAANGMRCWDAALVRASS